VALNKVDLPEARERAEALKTEFRGKEVFLLSGATQEGTRDLLQRLLRLLQETTPVVAPAEAPAELPVLRPRGRERLDIEELEEGVFKVRGARAEEDALKLGEGGYEALEELQDRLKRMGLEKGLRRAGAKPGALLRVGAVQLEWYG
jgi:GTP-binding protein